MKRKRHTALRTGGSKIRLTKTRRNVIIAMAKVGKTFSVSDLLSIIDGDGRLPARSTVSRTLSMLVSNGLLVRYRSHRRGWVYEKVYNSANGSRLICIACGEINVIDNEQLKFETESICGAYNFRVESISTNVFGICLSCRFFQMRQN